MSNRHSSRDEFREPANRHSSSRGSTRDNREPTREKRPREEPSRRGRIDEEAMDVDMDEDSDDYDQPTRREVGRTEKYQNPTSRNPLVPTTSNRHGRGDRGDRTPPETAGRDVIDIDTRRDQPRPKPGSDRDFWIPDEGIEREVISYEITRYLGQDALVRPGKNDKGRKGYLITAFRAPTTEMIRSMKEASEKYIREMQSTRSRPAAYSSSRTATGRNETLGQYNDREQQLLPRRRGGGYDSDDSMGDAPPVPRGYNDRDYDRRDTESRHRDRHARDTREDPRQQMLDPRYQDPRVQDPRIQDPRIQDPRIQDPRIQDPRYQDPRMVPDPRLADPRGIPDPRYQDRYQDPRDIPVTSGGRHQQTFTTGYADTTIPGYALSPSSQPPGFDYSNTVPRSGFNSNTPPPTSRAGQPMYVQPGFPPVSQGAQVVIDPRTGRQVLVPAGYAPDPRGTRHGR